MYIVDECPYYTPCGLCTLHGKDCNKVCGERRSHQNRSKTKRPDGGDKILQDIVAGKGLENFDPHEKIDEDNPPSGIYVWKSR